MPLPVPNPQALVLAAALLAGLGFYVWTRWPAEIPAPGSARAPAVQPVESVPGGPQTPEYRRLQEMADAARATHARTAGASATPSPPTLEARPGTPAARPALAPPATAPPAPPVPPAPPTPARPADADRAAAELARAMQQQAKELVAFRAQRFNPKPTRMVAFEDARGNRARAEAERRAEQAAARLPTGDSRDLPQPGDILYAVLQTAINSDEPGPVRAKVTGERFKGAILLGSLDRFPPVAGRRPERVAVRFDYLTAPEDRVAYAIKGYAIDLATARTALATGVDRHILSRWGSLVAASFLEGYGKAVRYQNRITTVGPLGNVVSVPKDGIDDAAIAREALGTVGERLADAVEENFHRPNTITVDAGAGIGVLIVAPSAENERSTAAHPESRARSPRGSAGRAHRSAAFPDGAPIDPVFVAPATAESPP